MRNIFTVNATQVVITEAHPEGLFSVVSGYPKNYDSRAYNATEENPNGDEQIAKIVAQAEYADRVKQLSLSSNRAMWTVTLEQADGRQIDRKTWGAMPDMTPPEPEPEPEPQPEPNEE